MWKFIKKTVLITSFIIVWGLINVLVDPFNYFNLSLIDNDAKKSAMSLNTLMYRTLDYMHNPSENMLIGDSRTQTLPIDLVEKLSGKKWKKLNTNAAKLNEIFDLFYMANDREKIERIIIGINFNMFNEYGYMDRVSGLKEMLENPLLYIYNKDVTEATFYTIRSLLFGKEIISEPRMTKDEFWKWNIETKATHWYGKYKFPENLHDQLIEFDEYTKVNGVEVIFIITPHHENFHARLIEFGLEEEEKQFKKIMFSLHATVYDYDYSNVITKSKNNFSDPVHYNDSIGELIVREILQDSLKIGIRNK